MEGRNNKHRGYRMITEKLAKLLQSTYQDALVDFTPDEAWLMVAEKVQHVKKSPIPLARRKNMLRKRRFCLDKG